MTKFLIFAGQEFYANGGANDIVPCDCSTEEEAIAYAKLLLVRTFTTNYWGSELSITIEWVQVFSIERGEVIFRRGNVFGDDSGIVIL